MHTAMYKNFYILEGVQRSRWPLLAGVTKMCSSSLHREAVIYFKHNDHEHLICEFAILLWGQLLQCLSCILRSFSLLSQLSHTSKVSPLSNFTLSCVSMMAEPKKGFGPRICHSTMRTTTTVSLLYPKIFLTPFSTVSYLYSLSSLKFHSLMSLHDGRTQERLRSANLPFFYNEICDKVQLSNSFSTPFSILSIMCSLFLVSPSLKFTPSSL